MIRYLLHEKIDKKKWDESIRTASNGMVYASSWYLDIVSPGWDALIEDDYTYAFPLTHHKKYGISYLRQPHFTQQLGLFSKRCMPNNIVEKHLAVAADKFKFIEINLNTENQLTSGDFSIHQMLTHHLNLEKDYETLSRNYSENLLRNISKARKAALTLETDADENDIIKLFRQFRGKSIDALKTRDYLVLSAIIKEARKRGLVQVIGANTSAGRCCAGAIFLTSYDKIIFLFSATSEEAKKNGAMSMIIDHIIRKNSSQNLTLDFEGSIDKNLARFYKSFNSKEAVYLRIHRNNLPKFVRWMKR